MDEDRAPRLGRFIAFEVRFDQLEPHARGALAADGSTFIGAAVDELKVLEPQRDARRRDIEMPPRCLFIEGVDGRFERGRMGSWGDLRADDRDRAVDADIALKMRALGDMELNAADVDRLLNGRDLGAECAFGRRLAVVIDADEAEAAGAIGSALIGLADAAFTFGLRAMGVFAAGVGAGIVNAGADRAARVLDALDADVVEACPITRARLIHAAFVLDADVFNACSVRAVSIICAFDADMLLAAHPVPAGPALGALIRLTDAIDAGAVRAVLVERTEIGAGIINARSVGAVRVACALDARVFVADRATIAGVGLIALIGDASSIDAAPSGAVIIDRALPLSAFTIDAAPIRALIIVRTSRVEAATINARRARAL